MVWAKLRKFGVQHCDLPTMLWNISFMLKAIHLNIDNRFSKRIPAIFYVVAPIFAAVYAYVYFFSTIWFVFCRSIKTGDLVAAMIVFSLGLTSEIGVTKSIYIFIYRKKIRKLLDQYLNCDSMVEPGSRFSRNLLKFLRHVKKRAVIYWIVINFNGVLYIVKPLVLPGKHSMEDIFILYGLEPAFETPNYEITYLLMAIGTIVTCYLASNIAVFLIVISGYVEAQLLALSHELLHMYDDCELQNMTSDNTNDEFALPSNEIVTTRLAFEEVNRRIDKRLREIAKIHMTNISLLLQVQVIFRGAFAIEFLVLSGGLIAELLGGLENTYLEVPFALMQVAMDCLVGQRLMDACNSFENAIYNCRWERMNTSNMKTVLLMLMMSQKTLTLSSGGVAILNFACLKSVFRFIYSAFTTLRSVISI